MYENYGSSCLSAVVARTIYAYWPANVMTIKTFYKEALYPLFFCWIERSNVKKPLSVHSLHRFNYPSRRNSSLSPPSFLMPLYLKRHFFVWIDFGSQDARYALTNNSLSLSMVQPYRIQPFCYWHPLAWLKLPGRHLCNSATYPKLSWI